MVNEKQNTPEIPSSEDNERIPAGDIPRFELEAEDDVWADHVAEGDDTLAVQVTGAGEAHRELLQAMAEGKDTAAAQRKLDAYRQALEARRQFLESKQREP